MSDRQSSERHCDHQFSESIGIIWEAFQAGLTAAAADNKLDRALAELRSLKSDIHQLRQEIHHMSQSLSAQLDAANALAAENNTKMSAAVADLATDVTELMRLVAEGTGPVGSTITQAQADAATAAATAGADMAQRLTNLAATFPAVPPSV